MKFVTIESQYQKLRREVVVFKLSNFNSVDDLESQILLYQFRSARYDLMLHQKNEVLISSDGDWRDLSE